MKTKSTTQSMTHTLKVQDYGELVDQTLRLVTMLCNSVQGFPSSAKDWELTLQLGDDCITCGGIITLDLGTLEMQRLIIGKSGEENMS